MAILKKKIDGATWEKEIKSDKITSIKPVNSNEIIIEYMESQFDDYKYIQCNSISF